MTAKTAMTYPRPGKLEPHPVRSLVERPSPHVGTPLMLRITDRADGRELVRRLHRIVSSSHTRPPPRVTLHSRWRSPIPVSQPWESPRARWTASPRSSAKGWQHALLCSETSVRAVPSIGSSRSGAPMCTLLSQPPPDETHLQAAAEKARRAHTSSPGIELVWRQDCYQLATGRTSFGFKDGIGQPAVEGSGSPPRTPGSDRSRPARSCSDTPTRPASCRPCRRRTCWVATAPTSCFASCTRRWRLTAPTCASGRRAAQRRTSSGPRWSGAGRAEHRCALAPDHDDPALGADSQRNNDFGFDDDARGFKCPVGAHARRANPRDALDQDGSVDVRLQPHDPARDKLRTSAPAWRPGGRRCRPRDHLRVRRYTPQAPVRVRQDPVAQRRHLHRGPGGEGSPGRSERRVKRVHHSSAPNPPQAAEPAAVRGDPGGDYFFAPGLRAMRWLAELDT